MRKATDQLESLDKGWSVQIYSPNRRLLCSIYPSHAWAFSAGLALGLILALVSLSHQTPTHSSKASVPSSIAAPVNLD
ncbi:hypothetical protein ACN4EK_05115 [Pantanalinema rosaneae CENA516]|uniref:hypothetical protein n=1 Tax=Pantanalinema rosaneae TaxID=1620701 RepID=UPI003D6F9BA3